MANPGGAAAAFGSRVLRRGGILRTKPTQGDEQSPARLKFARGVRPGSAAPEGDDEMPMEYQMGGASFYTGPAMAVGVYASNQGYDSLSTTKPKDWGRYDPDDEEVLTKLFRVKL